MFVGPALYPLEDAHDWAEKYQLEVMEVPCMTCGAPLLLTRPWATKGMRGLTAFPCKECGETKTPFTFITTD